MARVLALLLLAAGAPQYLDSQVRSRLPVGTDTELPRLGTQDGFTPIFDGKSLAGWVPRGGGKFSVDQGTILCETGTGAYGWLCSEKKYGDFILEVEARVEGRGNSGIQVRSRIDDKDLMVGYQFDLDRTRPSSGRLYDEARRQLLQDVPERPECRNALKPDDWNVIRAECVADRLRSWVNGVAIVDYVDTMDVEGILALQVHSGLKDPVRIRFRNLRIKDLGRRRWKPIFDGKTFSGWRPIGKGEWKIQEGVITGRHSKSEAESGHMATEDVHRDFTVRLQFKSLQGESGFCFRSEERGPLGLSGLQARIEPKSPVRGLYESNGRGWVSQPKEEEVAKRFKPREWNEMTVSARGTRIAMHLNGWRMAELPNDEKGLREGRFALQLHGGQDVQVLFKEIEILGEPE